MESKKLFRGGYEATWWQIKEFILRTMFFCCLCGKSWVLPSWKTLTISEGNPVFPLQSQKRRKLVWLVGVKSDEGE